MNCGNRSVVDATLRFINDTVGHEREIAIVCFQSKDGDLLGFSMFKGCCVSVDLPLRDLTRQALAFHAQAIILVHNHPSGDPKPSKQDITMTQRVARLFRDVDIELRDHLIVCKPMQHFSFYAEGML